MASCGEYQLLCRFNVVERRWRRGGKERFELSQRRKKKDGGRDVW